MFLRGFQKSKNNKIPKQEKQKTTITRKICKTKSKYYDSKQNKTKTKKQKKHSLKQKNKQNKNKKQEPDTEMRNRKEGRNKKQEREIERERERDKERESEKGGGPKRLKRNKGRHSKINKHALVLGGKQGFSIKHKERKARKTKKQQTNKQNN